MNEAQSRMLNFTAHNILNIKTSTPLLVGIDGKDASGKTIFANNLSAVLQEYTDREIIRISLDNFFQPRKVRAQQENQARGCYEDTFNNKSIIEHLLASVRSNGTYTAKIFDYETDSPVNISVAHASSDAILVIDGVFLQRPEFRKYWNYTVLLDITDETAVERGSMRDTERIGDITSARQKYINCYIASQKIYYDECNPRTRASIIIDNTDYKNPTII